MLSRLLKTRMEFGFSDTLLKILNKKLWLSDITLTLTNEIYKKVKKKKVKSEDYDAYHALRELKEAQC